VAVAGIVLGIDSLAGDLIKNWKQKRQNPAKRVRARSLSLFCGSSLFFLA
jgi:hypothetical protein